MQSINFFEAGNGYTLVFLHGFCESNKIWKELSTNLSNQFRVICPDLPGFGKSPLPKQSFSLEEIADTIVEFLKDLGIQDSVVIGHSLGGYISLEILRKYPTSTRAIGLFNSTAFEDPEDKKENRNKLIQFVSEHGLAPFLKTFVPSLFYPATAKNHQLIIDEIEQDGLFINPESVMGYAAAMRDRKDSTDLLKDYSDQILLIAGEQDQNVPLDQTIQMARYILQENVHVMPESAHMSLFEQPDACYDAIRKFAAQFSN